MQHPVPGSHRKIVVLGSAAATPGTTPQRSPGSIALSADGASRMLIALCIEDSISGQSVFYAPGPACVGENELGWMEEADCLLLDAGLVAGDASDTGTMSDSMMQQLRRLSNRKVLAHDGLEIEL